MAILSPVPSVYSPAVQAMIPLYYAAWADRVLTTSEVKTLKKQAANLFFLRPADKRLLAYWSDALRPPSRHLYQFWEIELRKAVDLLPKDSTRSLVDLGLAMAKKASENIDTTDQIVDWDSPLIRTELELLENQLKQVSLEAYRSIFKDSSFDQPIPQVEYEAPFDPVDMQVYLDGDTAELRNKMKILLTDPLFKTKTLRVKEDYRAQVLEWCHYLADQGIGALAYPTEYGGKDSMSKYGAAFETLAMHDLSLAIKFGVQFGLFGGSVHWLGTKYHHDKYLEDIAKLKLPGCFAMTETGHGSNVRGLETTAIYDPQTQEFIINTPVETAGKEYIGNALHGRIASVFAQLIVGGENHGVHALLVPLRDENHHLLPGIRIEDNGYKMGLNGVDNGRIWFDQVRVPRKNLLNRFGDVSVEGVYTSPIESPARRFFTMLGTLVGGRVFVPQAALSASKVGLEIAIRYALKRRQFSAMPGEREVLLLDYPSHQRRLLPLLAKSYALHAALRYLTDRFVHRTESDVREVETLAAGLKSYATWFTTECLQECREACGGKGYLSENRFDDLKNDTEIFTTFEGDNTVLMQLVAKGVISDFRKEFEEEGNFSLLRYISGRVTTSLLEKNPLTIRQIDSEHLRDSSFIVSAFQYREARLLDSLMRRIRTAIKQGESAAHATQKAQTHLIALAEAYVERVVIEKAIHHAQHAPDGDLQQVLLRLATLYGLHTIEKNRGWYLENDYIANNKSKAIRREVDALCGEVRPWALALVRSFGIPGQLLNAKIVEDPSKSRIATN